MGSRELAPRPRRSTPRSAASGRHVDKALLIEVPIEDLIGRFAGRRICKAGGHVYNDWFKPPKVWGVCDVDGSELVHRADDAEATVRARMEQQLGPLHEVADYYRDQGILVAVNGLQPIEDVATQPARCPGLAHRDHRVITRKSPAEIEKMRRAGRIVAEVLALMESELKPGVTTAHLDRLAEQHIRSARAVPSFKGYLGGGRLRQGPVRLPGEHLHLDRLGGRPRHPGRADDPRRLRRDGRCRGDPRWLARRWRADVPRG